MTITEKLISEYLVKSDILNKYLLRMATFVEDILTYSRLEVYDIAGRVKSLDSLKRKLASDDIGSIVSVKEINDLIGLRIVVYCANEVLPVVRAVRERFKVLHSLEPKLILDKNPSFSGYPMTTLVVELPEHRLEFLEYERYSGYKIEVQICTIMQHAWEKTETYLGYKHKLFPNEKLREFSQLAYILELYDTELNSIKDFLTPISWQSELPENNVENEIKVVPQEQESEDLHVPNLLDMPLDEFAEFDDPALSKIVPDKGVPIDKTALENVILTSVFVRHVDGVIATLYDARLLYVDKAMDVLVDAIGLVGVIKTSGDIEELLYKHRRIVFRVSKYIFGVKKNHEYILKGVSVYFLLYLLVAKQGDLEQLRSYLEKFTIDKNLVNKSNIRMLVECAVDL
ncbi:MAG: RelA/SpoT domain-containing protein [Magnetococcales bacterium]|nr:RelA/SpoT domain-containing protein [Magnetococcales bacterium]